MGPHGGSGIQRLGNIGSYIEVVKPRLILLLVFTSLGAMIVASSRSGTPLPASVWLPGLLTGVMASAGCNALTSYIDRDIDAVMARTSGRPLPSRRIAPPERALYMGIILTFISLVLAGMRNLLSFLCILLGVLDNVVVYSMMTKRRSPLNIVLGGFSGGLAPLFGWVYAANSISLTAVLISSMVVLWIPSHIWALAIYYRSDYERARVPMLPVVVGTEKAIRCIASTVILLFIFSIALYLNGSFGPIYLVISLGSGLCVLAGHVYLFFRPSPEIAWRLFKISSPYLFLLFLAMIVDSLMG